MIIHGPTGDAVGDVNGRIVVDIHIQVHTRPSYPPPSPLSLQWLLRRTMAGLASGAKPQTRLDGTAVWEVRKGTCRRRRRTRASARNGARGRCKREAHASAGGHVQGATCSCKRPQQMQEATCS